MYILFNFFSKVYLRLKSKLVLFGYKLIYGKRFEYGKRIYFRNNFKIRIAKDAKLSIGSDNFFNSFCSINALECICIGNNNIFGENIHIYDHNHKISQSSWDYYTKEKLIIGNHNWLGTNTIILKGSRINDNVVIGAGSIINFEVKSDSIYFKDSYIERKD